jgi:hypothetical protein
MLPFAISAASPASHPGLLHAGITLAAIRAAWPAPAGLKRITWQADLDTPVWLVQEPAPGQLAYTTKIIFTDPAGPPPDGSEQARLVLLTVTNTGLAPIRDQDFTTPLTFTFPGRQVRGTQIHHRTAAGTPITRPGLRAQPARSDQTGPRDSPGSIRLHGQFNLKHNDTLTLAMILTGGHDDIQIRQEARSQAAGSPPGRKSLIAAADSHRWPSEHKFSALPSPVVEYCLRELC